jgi:hypothetical protein
MPGVRLGIGETNPKRGAVQWDARRIDGVEFVIPAAAGISTAPIGSVVSLQENSDGKQIIVLGAAAYTGPGSDDYSVIALGFLEAATQVESAINQTVGEYADGDYVCMISDIDAVAMVPVDVSAPSAGVAAYITAAGKLSSSSSDAEIFPGAVWYGTPGVQNTGQLKTGYAFARLATVVPVEGMGA